MKWGRASLAIIIAACVVLAMLTVFAIELSNTQAKSKHDIESQVHQRAAIAGALIDSLFQTAQQQVPQYRQIYGTPTVSNQAINSQVQHDYYLALLGPAGEVIAASKGFNAQAKSDIEQSRVLALIHSGRPYALGNLVPYGHTGALDFAVALHTRYGTRVLVTGFPPDVLNTFVSRELARIPGVKGSYNYLVDGAGTVLATTNPKSQLGKAITQPGAAQAIQRTSADAGGYYFNQAQLSNSTWRIVLSSPDGPLFSSVSGVRLLVPWLIFAAFAMVAMAALVLGRRVLVSADKLREANAKLATLNGELQRANTSLEVRAAELARSNSELEQFASIASHDLQEPLRKIRTFTDHLSVVESERLTEKGRDYLARTNSAAERMQKLIEDLLRFSRVTTQGRSFSAVDLGQVTREVLGDLEGQVERLGAVVRVGPLPAITADPLQMRQLMQNLISNAVKFHREGVAPEVSVGARVVNGSVELTVADNGIGFDPRYSLRIFRVFERLNGRNEYPGTGIGLALCRKIVERHGGSIVAESLPGTGSTFTVTLPLRARNEAAGPYHQVDVRDSAPAEELAPHV